MTFTGNTSNTVALYMASPGCLRVLDDGYSNEKSIPDLPDEMAAITHLSDLSNITAKPKTPASPAARWFGAEPAHTWCYYFAKAELARQQHDWQTVINLWNEAQSKGFSPSVPSEKLPFIYAYAYLGQIDPAVQMTRDIIKVEPKSDTGMCYTWNRISNDIPRVPVNQAKIKVLFQELRCN